MSKKAEETVASIGVDCIGIVKTNTKGFFKATIKGLTKDWPGGSYIVLRSKPIVPGETTLFDIGYKYNSQKFISFVATAGSGSTMLGVPYLSNYPNKISNVSIRRVSCPHIMSNIFALVNGV